MSLAKFKRSRLLEGWITLSITLNHHPVSGYNVSVNKTNHAIHRIVYSVIHLSNNPGQNKIIANAMGMHHRVLLYFAAQRRFLIGGKRVTCRRSKITYSLGRTELTNSLRKQQLELSTRT